jgi:hypothetical protein
MKIGALRDAKIAAGSGGLDNFVEVVSTMEFDGFEIEGLGNMGPRGNEMVISSLSYFAKNPEGFTALLKRYTKPPMSCFVLFYVGHVMKKLPRETLSLCDKTNTPIIIMPNDFRISYVDVIMPVTEAILNDKHSNRMFVSDILQELIDMGDENQTIHSLLSLLRKRVGVDLILTDTTLHPLDWATEATDYTPTDLLRSIHTTLKGRLPLNPFMLTVGASPNPLEIRSQPIRNNKLVGMLLAVSKSEQEFDIDGMTQAAEVLKLFLHVWRLTRSRLCELDALLHGGSAGQWERKIRRLTVIRNKNGLSLDHVHEKLAMINMLSDDRFSFTPTGQVTYFSGSIVIADQSKTEDVEQLLDRIEKNLNLFGTLQAGVCSIYDSAPGIQENYGKIVNALSIAPLIFPDQRILDEEKISFASEIQNLRKNSAADWETITDILTPLMCDDRWQRHSETLNTLFLDCGGSVPEAAARLDIHVNTMKYRLRVISELLGQNIMSPLCSSRLVFALAVRRVWK